MPPAATIISLEGKNFQTLKSFPIDFKAYLREKLLFSYVIVLIPSLISCYTLIINSAFPYLSWKEEIEVYKSHKSTLITVFTDMGITMVTIGLAIGLAFVSPYVSGIVITSIYLILSIILYLVLMKKSSKKLATIEVFD